MTGELNVIQRQIARGLLADALDALDSVPDAFAMYTQVKQAFAARHAARFGEGGPVESHLAFMQRLTAWFERQDPQSWSSIPTHDYAGPPIRQHFFLLGYLRSGVTLVESILASLGDIRVLEEGSTLVAGDALFLKNSESLARLNPLDPRLASQARDAYWRRVREAVPDVEGKVFVDMSPLYGIKLPMIARLFPSARVVVCRRDPRDVVLSCFRRSFSPNALTAQLTARGSLAITMRRRLTKNICRHCHCPQSSVFQTGAVSMPQPRSGGLSARRGARTWNFDRRRGAGSTPAGHRSVAGSSMAAGRRRYRAQLEPVLPVLQSWVSRYGYLP
jgi:hypothetical protein